MPSSQVRELDGIDLKSAQFGDRGFILGEQGVVETTLKMTTLVSAMKRIRVELLNCGFEGRFLMAS